MGWNHSARHMCRLARGRIDCRASAAAWAIGSACPRRRRPAEPVGAGTVRPSSCCCAPPARTSHRGAIARLHGQQRPLEEEAETTEDPREYEVRNDDSVQLAERVAASSALGAAQRDGARHCCDGREGSHVEVARLAAVSLASGDRAQRHRLLHKLRRQSELPCRGRPPRCCNTCAVPRGLAAAAHPCGEFQAPARSAGLHSNASR